MWIFFAAALLDFLCRNQCAQALKTVGRNQSPGGQFCQRFFQLLFEQAGFCQQVVEETGTPLLERSVDFFPFA